jgi:hypothetical protein
MVEEEEEKTRAPLGENTLLARRNPSFGDGGVCTV